MKLYLNVPYAEKNQAKILGAKWDINVKKWYIDTAYENYVKFAKWLLKDTDEAIIATEYIYIIEGEQRCWKCHQKTKVIGLGIAEYTSIYGEPNEPMYELNVDNDILHLAWTDNENEIPPKLLKYLKEHYSVKTGYSRTLDADCFANHCDICGAIQGNYFLFDEPTSPLSSDINGKRLVNRISKLKIYGIPIDEDLQLKWDISFGDNDYAYFEYGKFEEIILATDPEDYWISYQELYNL